MKLHLQLSLCLLLGVFSLQAQNYKFGKVSKEELQAKSHSIEEDASAAILYRNSYTKFDYSDDDGFVVATEYHERIKIYSKDGNKYATKTIGSYKDGSSRERISNLKAVTYNLVDGKIKETKLKKNGIFEEEASKTRDLTKFTMPDVQDGSIIEFQYTLISPFIANIDEFRFQEEIPVDKVEMRFIAPEYFTYRTHGKGGIPLNMKNETRERTINYHYERNSVGRAVGGTRGIAEREIREKGYVVSLENIPALKKEPYAGNIENYMSALQFELALTQFPGSQVRNYSTSWEDVAKKIYASDNFGEELSKKSYFNKDVDEILQNKSTQKEKATAIFEFLKKKMNWNEYYGVYCDLGVKKAYKESVGNIADINLMLTAMFRYAGIESSPVLISTKTNGIPFFPTRTGYNYVVSGAKINDKIHLFDAADKHGTMDILKRNLLNWNGRMVKSDGSSRLINVYPKKGAIHNSFIKVEIDEDLNVTGNSKNRYSGHYAREARSNFKGRSEEERLKKMSKDFEALDMVSLSFKDMDNDQKPLTMEYDFESEDVVEEIGGKLYISPLMHLGTKENPFKSETRSYPIDFIYPYEDKFNISFVIPQGYVLESLPEELAINLPEGMGSFRYGAKENMGMITISVQNAIKTYLVDASYYGDLQAYFKMVVEKQNEKLVLIKG